MARIEIKGKTYNLSGPKSVRASKRSGYSWIIQKGSKQEIEVPIDASKVKQLLRDAALMKTLWRNLRKAGLATYVTIITPAAAFLAFLVLIPPISMDVGPTLDPKDPFETHFIATNSWFLSVFNIQYNCIMVNFKVNGRPEWSDEGRVGLDTWPRIAPQGKFSLYCGAKHSAVQSFWPGFADAYSLDEGRMDISVRFYPIPFVAWRWKRDFSFAFKRAVDGSAVWLPMGAPFGFDGNVR